ncbi:MAG: asparagine synthase (glutamine-hydrolyzing) [Bacteroidetes bacterium]|uniref:asparagine synthase (glutamine-hydrolyzing) n=1 Tax=Phnomibacter sp. TaxID=2836217 RepID=UPI002FDD177C|nr:asparagine synthase (glutamine-hydrolyzing) [Bacteroidota bacterium]
MCGIAGIIGKEVNAEVTAATLHALQHRGPNAAGNWQQGEVWLGHRRLSIIDLSDLGNQPMHSKCGRYVMVYNGEIYNYLELAQQYLSDTRLVSKSDSEVLLELFVRYGDAIYPQLNGMFSIAIWDTSGQTLFVCRDRFGVKPFYYTHQGKEFVFASEIKAFKSMGLVISPNDKVWAGYLANGTYGMPSETFWNPIAQLPGGYAGRFHLPSNSFTTTRWYKFETAVRTTQQSFDANAYSQLLQDAIALRFRADVPVGVAVSGGLDSSLLLAAIHQQQLDRNQLHAFTFYSNHAAYDELPWVEPLLQTMPGIQHHKILLTPNDVMQSATQMATQQDEPFGGIPTIAYAQIFKAAKERNIPVLLDGQGVDEAWAGYDYYWNNSNALVQGTKQLATQRHCLNDEFVNAANAEAIPTPFFNRVLNMQYRDLFYTKLPRALRFNDRASMQHSIELREPLLDYRLVEMAFALQDADKVNNGLTKWQLRKLAQHWLGDTLTLAPKRPVQTPQREWLKNELREWADAHIQWLCYSGNPGWMNAESTLQTWQQYLLGYSDNSFYIWQWINTSLLLQQMQHSKA